jgi:hypothetical protein
MQKVTLEQTLIFRKKHLRSFPRNGRIREFFLWSLPKLLPSPPLYMQNSGKGDRREAPAPDEEHDTDNKRGRKEGTLCLYLEPAWHHQRL